MKQEKEGLDREIGFLGLSSNIINTIIGSGIFVLPAIIAASLGAASILAYVFCGILITLLMLCVAEMSSKITSTGGVYIYIEKTFGAYSGFLTFGLMLLASVTAVGAIANAIVNILFEVIPLLKGEMVRILLFVLMFYGLGYINVLGVKKGVGFVKLITLIKIAPLLLLVLIGFKDVQIANLIWETAPSMQEIGSASLILYFAFTGASTALSVSGEVRNPQKTIPRAILFSIFIVGVIYVAVQSVSQGVLGSTLPSFEENPLGAVANHIFGPIGFTLLTIGAGVSMFGSTSSMILSCPRILFAASTTQVIPIKVLSRIHSSYHTPHIAIISFVSLCFIFALFGGFKALAVVSSASALIVSLGLSLATIKLRRNGMFETGGETFKIPGGYIIPMLSVLVILWFLSNLSEDKLWGIGLYMAILTGAYLVLNVKGIFRLMADTRK